MSRGAAWYLHLSTLLVGGGGLVYGWMRYFAEPTDEFAIVNHPWQPAMHALHVLAAPLLVFGCGLLWRDHVWARVRSGAPARRRSGLLLFSLVFLMIASGYLLQTAVDEAWRSAWMWIHGVSSTLWLASYVAHLFVRRPRLPA